MNALLHAIFAYLARANRKPRAASPPARAANAANGTATTACPDHRAVSLEHQPSSGYDPTPVYSAIDVDQLRARAEVQAKKLLLRQLTPQQRAQFDAYGNFSVTVAGRGTFYIFPCRAFNVVQVSTGHCYCCVPEARVPLSDLMLSQKLLLETDPEQFFSIANRKPNLIIDVVAASTRKRYSASSLFAGSAYQVRPRVLPIELINASEAAPAVPVSNIGRHCPEWPLEQ